MKHYHIGLDFGTYQSKACIYSLEDDTHEFFRFSNGTFFMPSRVAKNSDGRFEYGSTRSGMAVEEYTYFKIAAAEDEEFHVETFDESKKTGQDFYNFNEFRNYSPEFLSVIYLTYLLFSIKEKYRQQSILLPKTGGILSRLIRRQEEVKIEVGFTSQLGIPTEWSQVKNLRRKRKFENILMLSEILQEKYGTLSNFLEKAASELISQVQSIYTSYNFLDKDAYEKKLNDLGISVYPETAAGLTFIIRTHQLQPGYYAIMDIGGGTTDISFFRLPNQDINQPIRYLASESFMMACNNIYHEFVGGTNSLVKLKQSETEVLTQVSRNVWKNNIKLCTALKTVNDKLQLLLYKLFNESVYRFNPGGMVDKYKDQPVIIYGGGAFLPLIKDGEMKYFDNGNRVNKDLWYFMEKQDIGRYTSLINILPNDDSWKKDFSLLVVALGLSYIKPLSSTAWFTDIDYHSSNKKASILVQHPFNEDCYIYDVLASKWY